MTIVPCHLFSKKTEFLAKTTRTHTGTRVLVLVLSYSGHILHLAFDVDGVRTPRSYSYDTRYKIQVPVSLSAQSRSLSLSSLTINNIRYKLLIIIRYYARNTSTSTITRRSIQFPISVSIWCMMYDYDYDAQNSWSWRIVFWHTGGFCQSQRRNFLDLGLTSASIIWSHIVHCSISYKLTNNS